MMQVGNARMRAAWHDAHPRCARGDRRPMAGCDIGSHHAFALCERALAAPIQGQRRTHETANS
eukprot:7267844-Alexandrium_andersonii.AAC.1